jgi:outer membrane protein assembly factor BamA
VIVEDETRVLQIDRGFSGILSYPFSRAQRVDLTGGLRQITGKTDVTSTAFDYFTGDELGRETQTISTFPTLNLAMVSSALVYDTSIFGATSPIRGARYRLEMDHTAGDITYSAALADGRTYFMPRRPFTVALRGMYYGRFGRDAESQFLSPVFIGYPELVRGYDYNSFEASECGATTDGSCPVFDRLIGSRMVVANVELRAPVWGLFGGGRRFYGPLPVDVGVFADAGAAWGQGGALRVTGPDRNLVRSVGVLLRVNLLGFAVGQLDYARPLDRPGRGWIWQFSLRPGF